MPIAYQEQAQLTCPACGAEFAASVWLILDAQEEPVATEALRRGDLNQVVCPHCGNAGPAGAPLLFHDGGARRVIFAPAPDAEEHEIRDQARELHALLVGSIPEEQRRPYLAEVDIAQDLAGIAQILSKLDRRKARAGAGEQAHGERPLAAAAPPPATSESVPQTPPLLGAVEALLAADSPAELDRVLVAHPLLLDPSTDHTLAQLVEVALEQRAFDVAESLRNARAILGRMAVAAPVTPSVKVAVVPAPAFQALLQAASAQELLVVIESFPQLRRPEVDDLLAEQVNLALDEGNERLAQTIEERREALTLLRAAEQAPTAEEPTLDEAIEALLIAEGEAALTEAIDRYPVLLDDVVAQALWQFAAEARASGDEELARYAIECREMLRRVREGLEQ